MHAMLRQTAIWLVTAVVTLGGSRGSSLLGVVTAPDFVQFYTLGRLTTDRRPCHRGVRLSVVHDAQAAFVRNRTR
jgi:hypothetical protein